MAASKAGDADLLDINSCTVPSSQVDPGKGGQGTIMAVSKAADADLLDSCAFPSSQVDPGKGGQGTGMSASELQDPCPAALTEQTGCMAAGGAAEIVMI